LAEIRTFENREFSVVSVDGQHKYGCKKESQKYYPWFHRFLLSGGGVVSNPALSFSNYDAAMGR
jgi:hypothetical protein